LQLHWWANKNTKKIIGNQHLLAPIAVETLGPMNTSAFQRFANLKRNTSSTSGDEREGAFLFCREFRCWCSATTLYCYMTPCQRLTDNNNSDDDDDDDDDEISFRNIVAYLLA